MLRRIMSIVLVSVLALTITAFAQTDKEIVFRDTHWGMNYNDALFALGDYEYYYPWSGESTQPYSVIELITNKRSDSGYEYTDINIDLNVYPKDLSVAGYTVDRITLYFAYLPVEGVLTHGEEDTALYAARYTFSPSNADIVAESLKSKLESIYGDISKSGISNNWGTRNEWYLWGGANKTGAALCIETEGDKSDIIITYFTYEGDNWLNTASDAEKARIYRDESSAAQSDDTSGL